ncbi:hypothetical protein [Candidatus Albibeggiatoa sp. nov. NOAA]|uniref:hypothetical protein n=1 Tax=Candidatus Albibeggiatoa sp. nov. NOAA TaxID=3162724 RepID=UPI0032F62CEC|nr:hypothetical protein [Thiotrichaceae bacterium]
MHYLFSKLLRRKPDFYPMVALLSGMTLLPSAFAASCLDIPQTIEVEKQVTGEFAYYTDIYQPRYIGTKKSSTINSCTCYTSGSNKYVSDAQFFSYSREVSTLRVALPIPQTITTSCKNEAGQDLSSSLHETLCQSNSIDPNTTYYFKNPTEPNEYFACATDSTGEFTGYQVGLKKCDDGTYVNNSASCGASNNGIELKQPIPEQAQYSVSVNGNQAHIRSTPVGIDCEYGQGVCTYNFKENQAVYLEVVNVQADAGLTAYDYESTWSGHPDCTEGVVRAYGGKNCVVSVSKRQYVKDREASDNKLTFLNFSGHGISRGGAEDIVLGFILKNSGKAYTQSYVEGLDYVIQANGTTLAPQSDFYQVLYDESAGSFYGKLLYGKSANTSTYYQSERALEAGIYTMLLYPSDTAPQNYRRGMIGISLRNTALTLSDLSVRGHLQELVGLNFIIGGTGTQKMKISSTILQGQAEIQLILSNLSTGQILFYGTGLTSGTVDIGAGAYAATLNTLSGEGVGMIEIDFVQ